MVHLKLLKGQASKHASAVLNVKTTAMKLWQEFEESHLNACVAHRALVNEQVTLCCKPLKPTIAPTIACPLRTPLVPHTFVCTLAFTSPCTSHFANPSHKVLRT